MSVSFTPSALGSRTASLVITDTGAGSPHSASLSGTGTGAPPAGAVRLSHAAVVFGAQVVGTTSLPRGITLYNSGDATLNITSIVASGDFGIDSTTCGATLPAAASCAVNVSFTPRGGRNRTGAITFTTDAATSPDVVSTSGTGKILLTIKGHLKLARMSKR